MGSHRSSDKIGPARDLPCVIDEPGRVTGASELDQPLDIAGRARGFVAGNPQASPTAQSLDGLDHSQRQTIGGYAAMIINNERPLGLAVELRQFGPTGHVPHDPKTIPRKAKLCLRDTGARLVRKDDELGPSRRNGARPCQRAAQ